MLPVLFKRPGKVWKSEKKEKKKAVIRAWQKIDPPVCHFFVGCFFLFYEVLLRNNLSNG